MELQVILFLIFVITPLFLVPLAFASYQNAVDIHTAVKSVRQKRVTVRQIARVIAHKRRHQPTNRSCPLNSGHYEV